MKSSLIALAILALGAALPAAHAQQRPLKSVGVTLGNMGNPFFVSLAKGAEAEAKKINPNVKFTALAADYDLAKQAAQIDNFITSGVDLILINAVDPKALESAINRAKKAGIAVIGVDAATVGADAVVMTDNVQAGRIACEYIVEKLKGKGNVVIQNGPQVTAVIDRVKGCKDALAKAPEIQLLSSDQDGKGTREGGMNIMQGHLTRFPKIDAVFAINDPQAIGADLAARQLKRQGIVMTAVDGAPDVETALKSATQIEASASQDPFDIAVRGVQLGVQILNGQKPAEPTLLLPSKLVTRDNVSSYKGWQAAR